jgi:hypothetical protein
MAITAMLTFCCAKASMGQSPSGKKTGAAAAPVHTANPVPASTLELIRKQEANARQRAIEMGKMEAAGEINKASNEAKSVKEKAERTAAQMAGREGSASDGPQSELLRRQAAERAEELQRFGSLRAARKEQESEEKAEEIQRQSESLQEELQNNEDDQHRGIKLNPVGTNLYIRNYSIVKPNIQPLHAQQQSLPSTNVAGQMASHTVQGNHADARSTSASLKRVSTNVKGQLMSKQPTPR